MFKKIINQFKTKQVGSTLIELLVATTIIGISLTAVAIMMMYSVQKTAQARYEELAIAMAQDAIEVFQKERAFRGWDSFKNTYGGNNGTTTTYCVGTDLVINTCNNNNQYFVKAGTTFDRTVAVSTFTPITSSVTTLRVVSTVTWSAGAKGTRHVDVTRDFKKLY